MVPWLNNDAKQFCAYSLGFNPTAASQTTTYKPTHMFRMSASKKRTGSPEPWHSTSFYEERELLIPVHLTVQELPAYKQWVEEGGRKAFVQKHGIDEDFANDAFSSDPAMYNDSLRTLEEVPGLEGTLRRPKTRSFWNPPEWGQRIIDEYERSIPSSEEESGDDGNEKQTAIEVEEEPPLRLSAMSVESCRQNTASAQDRTTSATKPWKATLTTSPIEPKDSDRELDLA